MSADHAEFARFPKRKHIARWLTCSARWQNWQPQHLLTGLPAALVEARLRLPAHLLYLPCSKILRFSSRSDCFDSETSFCIYNTFTTSKFQQFCCGKSTGPAKEFPYFINDVPWMRAEDGWNARVQFDIPAAQAKLDARQSGWIGLL